MPGTTSACTCFTNVYGYESGCKLCPLARQLQSMQAANAKRHYEIAYSCDNIVSDYHISLLELQSWNSWLGSNCTVDLYKDLGTGSQRPVCVNATTLATPTAVPIPTDGPTTTTASTSQQDASAAPTQSGVTKDCDQWYTVVSGDSCSAIESKFKITFDQLFQWNPAVGDDCHYLDVGFAICIGISS